MTLLDRFDHFRMHSRAYSIVDGLGDVMLTILLCKMCWDSVQGAIEEPTLLRIGLGVFFAAGAMLVGRAGIGRIYGPSRVGMERGIREVIEAKHNGASYPELVKVTKKYAMSSYWSQRIISAAISVDAENLE